MSSHYNFENEQVELPVLTQLPENDVLHQDLADEQSEEENSDYDNNADESGDETPFAREDGDEEDEEEGPDLKRAPHRRKVNESEVPYRSQVRRYTRLFAAGGFGHVIGCCVRRRRKQICLATWLHCSTLTPEQLLNESLSGVR
uniref:Uncharacterized protein LOC104215658 n=1 Tax=Nicotiana sylvestris TaxID=4096 RepID=A0A1U7VFZ2_NICSY